MRPSLVGFALVLLLSQGAALSALESLPDAPRFTELWGYLMAGEEGYVNPASGLTDLAYFGASLNSFGELGGVPKTGALPGFSGRRHLVVAIQENLALTHMAVFPEFPVRKKLIADLVAAAGPFDGVQLDFESVSRRDKESFWSFLVDLKAQLGTKQLSLAVPAKTSAVDDAFDYKVLNALADRIVVMAYDEHWSGGTPGSVASLAWCLKVAQYAQSAIDPAKLVMGAPFYGRAWSDKNPARAYKFSGVAKLMSDRGVLRPTRLDGIPSFEYEDVIKVTVFYEDKQSQLARLKQYAALGVRNAAFWKLGQEDPDTWGSLQGGEAPPPDRARSETVAPR